MTNLSRDVERFVSVIRDRIEAELLEQVEALPYRNTDWIDPEWIDLDQLATAVHEAVVEHLGPPF